MTAGRGIALAVALAALAACAPRDARPGGEGSPWHETAGPHFTLVSDVPPAQARATVIVLEQRLAAFLRLGWSTEQFPGRVELVMLADGARFRELYPGIAGYYAVGGVMDPVMVTFAQAGDEGLEVLQHELNHHIASSALPTQPRWFAEGTATFFQTARFDDQGRFVLGAVPQDRYQELAAFGRMPSRELLSGQHADDDPRFYASAWALTHYLMMRRGEGFAVYQRALSSGARASDAWQQAFADLTPDVLDRHLVAYLETAEFDNHHLPFERPVVQVTSRALSAADGHAYTAIAYGAYGPTGAALTAARGSLGDAFAIEPMHFRARLVEVVLAEDVGHMVRLAQALVKAHPREWRAWLALALLQELADGSPEWHQRARSEALRQLTVLRPEHPRVLALGVADALSRQDTAQALRLSARAIRLAPHDTFTRVARAYALAANQEEADACAILQQVNEGRDERRGASSAASASLEAHCARMRQWTDAVLAPPP